ncbi:MAG: Rne/Rng family ribonuclease [Candidatus Planktophila sp.]|nr:Rne/Rng family ribonuclease [Candidatus Planktophila sp.]
MAIEPKTPRKRAVKKASAKADTPVTEVTEEKKITRKKAAAIPVAIFQAAPEKPAAKKEATDNKPRKKAVAKNETADVSEKPAVAADSESGDSEDRANRNRRRRRGGRGRRKPGAGDAANTENNDENSSEESADEDSAEGSTSTRRRRRRRATGEGVTPGETIEEDGVITVVKVREKRERVERPARPDRNDRGSRNRRDRNDRNDRGGRSDYREPYRKRGTIITDGEFLARRENVDREMLVRQIADRTQIAVIEDGVMVEHYVNRNSNQSYVGNVYLGRVQNVLPSMEAAFVDIGKGRNAVLYAGEVNWDAAGISESAPRKIETVLKTGQPVLVQVTKDPIGQKGARLTSQISLPGRYVVYVPGGGMSGISKRLPEEERSRLKAILKNLIPEEAGVIVRTAAEGVSEEDLTSDVARLKAQWDDIYAKSQNANFHPPAALYEEPDLAVRVIRDIFNEDFRKLTVQGSTAWDEVTNYLGFIAPELTQKIEKYTGTGDLFADFRVEEQLAKAFDRKVYLPSGGSLVIDRTEAMIVIDVNTGKFIGKGGNLEETVTKNNLEAAEEIARQLRLRDLGGIVVIDFIDMILESNREAVLRRLVECLGRDRTKHQVAEVTSLGLVQMTRKRVGQGLIEAFSTTCDSCSGRGIHIHMEPVKMKAPAPQIDTPSSQHEDADEKDATAHEFHESLNDDATTEEPEAPKVEVKAGGRKRRRASSSGIITA